MRSTCVGVTFQQALREEVGDEVYFAALRSYADSPQGDNFRDASAFFDAFQNHSDVDLTRIMGIYFK